MTHNPGSDANEDVEVCAHFSAHNHARAASFFLPGYVQRGSLLPICTQNYYRQIPSPEPRKLTLKKTQYGLNSILPDICRPIVAKYDLNYSRRSLALYSGSVPAFFRIMTSQFGGYGEKWYNRDGSGLRCTRITSGIPMTCQGLP